MSLVRLIINYDKQDYKVVAWDKIVKIKMSEKNEIRNRISTIWKSITYVEVYFKAFYSINDNLKANSSNSPNFFQLVGQSFWRIGIIEFAKLLSSKNGDKFRVEDLLKQLAPDQYWGKLKVETSNIERWKVRLEEQKDSIDTIIILRDEVYAHSDKASLGSDEKTIHTHQKTVYLS